jgi:flagellar basal-body rod protein FlgC
MRASRRRLRHVPRTRECRHTPDISAKRLFRRHGAGKQRASWNGRVRVDRTALDQIYDPSHPDGVGANGNYDGSNVNLPTGPRTVRSAAQP